MLNLHSLMNPEAPIAGVLRSVSSLMSSDRWSLWFNHSDASNLTKDLDYCHKALERISDHIPAPPGAAHSAERRAFESALKHVESEVEAIERWSPLNSTAIVLIGLIDSLNVAVGHLGDMAGIHRDVLQLPLTFAQSLRQEEHNARVVAQRAAADNTQQHLIDDRLDTLSKLNKLAELLQDISPETQRQLAAWEPPSGGPGALEWITQIVHAMKNISRQATLNINSQSMVSDSAKLQSYFSQIEPAIDVVRDWKAFNKTPQGASTATKSKTAARTLKQKLNIIINNSRLAANALGIFNMSQVKLPETMKEDRKTPGQVQVNSSLANGTSEFGRWAVMSQRRAAIYGLV